MESCVQVITINLPSDTGENKHLLLELPKEKKDLKENTTKFICPQKTCRKGFETADALLEHKKENHPRRLFKCPKPNCYWDFPLKKQLDKHLLHHAEYKPFKCQIDGCRMRFSSQYNLNSHLKQHEMKMMITCPALDCDEKFLTERSLILHKQLLHNDKIFKCKQCAEGPEFSSFIQWQVHRRSHSMSGFNLVDELRDVKMYPCKFEGCDAKFNHPYHLQKHVQTAHTLRSYTCPAWPCEKRFKHLATLKRHFQKHSKDREFHCDIGNCPKTFTRPDHLQRHRKIHTNKIVYTCDAEGCGRTFLSKDKVNDHAMTHSITETTECDINGSKSHYQDAHGITADEPENNASAEWKLKGVDEFNSKEVTNTGEIKNNKELRKKSSSKGDTVTVEYNVAKGKNENPEAADTPVVKLLLEKEVQTDIDLRFGLPYDMVVQPRQEESNDLLTSQDSLPFMSMTPPSVVIDRTLLRREHLQRDANRNQLSQMSALETLAHVAMFESAADRTCKGSPVSSLYSVSRSSDSSSNTKELGSSKNLQQDIFDRLEFIHDEALSDSNIFSIIQKDLECAENIEIPSTEDQGQDCNDTLILSLESPIAKSDSEPKIDVLIGTDDTLGRRFDHHFHTYFRTNLPEDPISTIKEDDHPKDFSGDNVEVEVETRCDLDSSIDGVSFNFGSILDHDGYISSASLLGGLHLNTER